MRVCIDVRVHLYVALSLFVHVCGCELKAKNEAVDAGRVQSFDEK